MTMTTQPSAGRRSHRGFTLIEVLIALLITSVGLLGVAKIQAASVSGTKSAGGRSLIALQVGSLVSLMHANRAYWATAGVAPSHVAVGGSTVIEPTSLSTATTDDCQTYCKPEQMAARDLQVWARDMFTQFPTYIAQVDCTQSSALPVSCLINVQWKEKSVAINKTTATGAAQQTWESFSVYANP